MNNDNKNLLDIVKVELLSRKTSSIDEVLKIIYLTKKLLKKSSINFYDIFEQVTRDLHQDIVNTIELNEYIFNYSNKLASLTYPLKSNKIVSRAARAGLCGEGRTVHSAGWAGADSGAGLVPVSWRCCRLCFTS